MILNAVNIPLQFNGGLNTQTGPLGIADNESPNCKNVHTNLIGTLQRRMGHTEFEDSGTAQDGWGVFDYWQNATTHYLMVRIGNKLFKMDVNTNNEFDGTLDEISLGEGMANSITEFEQVDEGGTNYLVMSTHNRDPLQKWNGSGATTILSTDTDAPKPRHIKEWKGYLFCANIVNYESRVYYNNVSGTITSSTAWSATDYQDIRTTDGDYITGLAKLKGRLYTFKRYSIHRWTYFGGTPLFGIKEAITGIGAIASETIKNINHPKYGEVLVFLGADSKFYAFDGATVFPISTKIETDNNGISEFNLTKLSSSSLTLSHAEDYKTRHWYVCWVPTGSETNWTIIWDYYTDTWWPMDGMIATSCGIGLDGGQHKLYFTKANGKLYTFDTGNNDDSSNVEALYDSKKYSRGNIPLLKNDHYLDLQLRNIDRDVSLYTRSDWASSWGTAETLDCNAGGFILGTSELGDTLGGPEAITRTVDLPVINHTQQFRIYTDDDDATWGVYGVDLVTAGSGYGKS